MLDPLRHMLVKEFIQVFRDFRMRIMVIGVPIIQVLIFGYAVSTDVRHIRIAVYDRDSTPASRDLVARFEGSGCFEVVQRLDSDADVREAMDTGRVKAVLRVDQGFGGDLAGDRTATTQLLLDGSDSNTTGIILGYASRIVAAFNLETAAVRAEGSSARRESLEPVTMAWRSWFNPNLESSYFFVPGVIALLVMVITVILSSMAVVREREVGTMEQIMVTPIGRMEFILGKTLPFALIGFLDVALISLVAVFWFRIPLEGSLFTLFLATGLYLLSTLGAGLFISTISHTQQQAMMTAFFFMMPALLLGGFMYPIANMPEPVQWLTYLNPLRYFLVIIRGVYLKGTGIGVLWPQMAGLALLGSTLLSLAAGRFKKTMA